MALRGVAQPGSAPVWGTGGRRFKSSHPDYDINPLYDTLRRAFSFCPQCEKKASKSADTGGLQPIKMNAEDQQYRLSTIKTLMHTVDYPYLFFFVWLP